MPREPTSVETPRLLLRPLRPESEADVAELAALLAEPDVYRFLFDGAPPSVAQVRELAAQSATIRGAHRVGLLLVTLRGERSLAGLAGLRPAEIGGLELVCALRPRFWGQGLAEEACRACLAHVFAGEDVAEVVAGADAPNSSSLRLIERLGFEPLEETPGAFGVIRWFVLRRSDGSGPAGGPAPGDRPSRP